MTSHNSVWNKSSTLAERIKANEDTYKKREEEARAVKEAIAVKVKEALDKTRENERCDVIIDMKNKQLIKERESYRKLIPKEWHEIWKYCYSRSNGSLYQDFIIAAYKSKKLNLVDQSVILLGSEAVRKEAKKHKISYDNVFEEIDEDIMNLIYNK